MPTRKRASKKTQQKPEVQQPPVVEPEDTTPVPETDFKKRLAEAREAKGLKHDSLSELTKIVDPQKRGIARTTLRGYELGIYKPGIRELRILSQALGINPTMLIFGTVEPIGVAPPVAVPEPSELHGIKRGLVLEWVCFAVALFRLDDASRESVFRVAATLAEARLGSVEYHRLMGATREIVDTLIDQQLDLPPDQRLKPRPELVERFAPIVDAILKKFGFKPPQREAAAQAGHKKP